MMQVGDRIYLYRNINLKFKIPVGKWANNKTAGSCFKDPSKGIVHQKTEGIVRRVVPDGEELNEKEIDDYTRGNKIMEQSFNFANSSGGVRVVVEFKYPHRKDKRLFRMLTEHKFEAGPKTMNGYARRIPNSIHFITEN